MAEHIGSTERAGAAVEPREPTGGPAEDARLGDQLRDAQRLTPLLDEMLAALAALQDADRSAMLVVDPAAGTLTAIASAGFSADHLRLLQRMPPSASPVREALDEARPTTLEDVQALPNFPQPELARAANIRGLHAQPVLRRDGSVAAVILSTFPKPSRPSLRQNRVAEVYARQAAWVLESARLHEQAAAWLRASDEEASRLRAELDRAAGRASILDPLSDALTRAVAMHDVGDAIARAVVPLTKAVGGALFLVTDGGARLERAALSGDPAATMASSAQLDLYAPGPAADAARTREPLLLGSAAAVAGRFAEAARGGARALAAVPLLIDHRPVGVLVLAFGEERQFATEERELLTSIAGLLAPVIRRVQALDAAVQAENEAREARQQAERERDRAVRDAEEAVQQRITVEGQLAEIAGERDRLSMLLGALPAGLIVAEAPSGRIVRGSERLVHILGRELPHSPDVASYAGWNLEREGGSPITAEELPLARALRSGEVVDSELLVARRPDGSSVFVRMRAAPVTAPGGDIIAAVALVNDVTEFRREEERLRFLADASSLLAASLDYEETLPTIARLAVPFLADLCIIDIIEESGEIRRVAAEHRHAPGPETAAQVLASPPDPTALHHPVVRALRTGMSDLFPDYPPPPRGRESTPPHRSTADFPRVSGEQLRQHDPFEYFGSATPRSLIVVPLMARGRTRGAITLAITESDRRYHMADLSLAEELARRAGLAVDNARLYSDAQEANHAKTQFLGVMSHELRTPLAAVIGYTELLLMGVPAPLPEPARQQVERVRSQANHLLHLIEGVFTYSRLEAGTEKGAIEAVDVRAVLDAVGAEIAPLAAEKSIAFDVTAPEAPLEMRTDGAKLRQILLNLLSNAVKFTERGEVRLEARAVDDDIVFQVSDTGVGIPPQHQERIFDPFWQVEHRASRRVPGTGLGLSVARRLARMLEGEVTVESEPGRGSTFRVRLPRRTPE